MRGLLLSAQPLSSSRINAIRRAFVVMLGFPLRGGAKHVAKRALSLAIFLEVVGSGPCGEKPVGPERTASCALLLYTYPGAEETLFQELTRKPGRPSLSAACGEIE